MSRHAFLCLFSADSPPSGPRTMDASPCRIPLLEPLALFAAYAAASLLLFRAAWIGDRSWFDSGDSSLQSWPWLLSVAHAARHGHLLLWDFGSQAGVSLAGELQPGPFYPPTWLLGLLRLDGLVLCDGFVLLHFALAATGMHLLLRGETLSRAAAVLGAALFAFAGYLPFQADAQPNIFASLCWMPLVLFGARRAFAAPGWREAVLPAMLAGLAGGLQIAAGHMQPFVHTSYAVMLCGLVSAVAARSARPVLLGLLGQAAAVCFAAVPLWLADQYLHLVYRWYADGMSRWPHAVPLASYLGGAALRWSDLRGLLQAGTLAEQDGSLFLGMAAAALALLGAFRGGAFAWSMVALLVFGLLAGLGGHAGPIALLFAHLPLLSQLRTPIRAACLLSLAAAALAACGLDLLGRRLSVRDAARGAPPGRPAPHRGVRSLLAVPLALCLWQVASFDRGVGRNSGNPQFAPAYYERNPALDALLRLSGQQTRAPLLDRFLCVPHDLVPPNAGLLSPVLGVTGQRATMMTTLFDTLSQGWGPGPSGPLDQLGVRWVVSDHPVEGLALRAQGPGFRIYERPHPLSVLWTLAPDGTRARAPVTSAQWGDDSARFILAPSPVPTRLVFAQPFYPGWIAMVDGRRVRLGREGILSAIELPAGAVSVRFAYRPVLLLPAIASLGACAVLLVLLAARVRRKRMPDGRTWKGRPGAA